MSETDQSKTENGKRPQFGARYLSDESKVFDHNAWDDVTWDEDQRKQAEAAVVKNSTDKVPEDRRQELEAQAGQKWDDFYQVHNNRFFKDRNWLFTEFPEILKGAEDTSDASNVRIMELGCGVGNTVFPILEMHPKCHMYAADFSPTAVQLVKEHKDYQNGRCTAFVLDMTDEEGWDKVPFEPESLDLILLIFALSALEPETMPRVVKRLWKSLKPGGKVLFRDYGQYDLAQLRFKPGKCLSDDFYVRGDGTRCYFFTPEKLRELFTKEDMFEEEQSKVDRRLQVNRGKQIKMYRVWIQTKYVKKQR